MDISWQSQVCAVIVSYNTGQEIHRCFEAVQGQVGHVVIVDNGSDGSTRFELNKLLSSESVTLILNRQNEGIAHAYNQAIHWAQDKHFRWILTLDHDSEATPGMVGRLLDAYAALEENGIHNTGIVGSNPFDVNLQHYLLYGEGEAGGAPLEDETEVISSGSLIAFHVFDKIGLFNEDLFIYYVDTDFCIRVKNGGFGIYVCLGAKLLHREGTKKRHPLLWRNPCYDHYSRTSRYYLTRNLIYIVKHHAPSLTQTYGMLRRAFKDHVKIILFDDERLAILWYSLRGFVDGLRGKVGPIDRRRPGEEDGAGERGTGR